MEFAPAWAVPQETVEALRRDAVKIAKSVHYVSAGTVEFLVDKNGGYYFIEMNPRIQVEHTVTEMVATTEDSTTATEEDTTTTTTEDRAMVTTEDPRATGITATLEVASLERPL